LVEFLVPLRFVEKRYVGNRELRAEQLKCAKPCLDGTVDCRMHDGLELAACGRVLENDCCELLSIDSAGRIQDPDAKLRNDGLRCLRPCGGDVVGEFVCVDTVDAVSTEPSQHVALAGRDSAG